MAGLMDDEEAAPAPEKKGKPTTFREEPTAGRDEKGAARDEAEAEDSPEGGDDEQPNVSPEEQAQYEDFVDKCHQLIYSQGAFEKVLERIKATPNPVEGLATVVATTVFRVQQSAVEAGQELSPDVLMQGGQEVLLDLADQVAKAGIHDYSEQEIEAATYAAVDQYREMAGKAGFLDEGAAVQDANSLVQMDRTGELDETLPGLKEKFAGIGGGDQPAEDPKGLMPDEQEGA